MANRDIRSYPSGGNVLNGAACEQRTGHLFIFGVLTDPCRVLRCGNVAGLERFFPWGQVFRSPLRQGAFDGPVGPGPANPGTGQGSQEADTDGHQPEARFIVQPANFLCDG